MAIILRILKFSSTNHLMAQIFIFFRLIFKKIYSPNNKKYSHKAHLFKFQTNNFKGPINNHPFLSYSHLLSLGGSLKTQAQRFHPTKKGCLHGEMSSKLKLLLVVSLNGKFHYQVHHSNQGPTFHQSECFHLELREFK